jgi:hypothetical protein
MDDFSLDRTELTGSLLSLEFGVGGRIQQLWAADPTLPDETEEFQFCCPPVGMGEESSEDYLPGTIMLGARTHPDDPWILSRNSSARPLDDNETDGALVGFEYEFGFLDELGAIGKFSEIPGLVPQVGWELQITNRSRRSVEIGELAFPFALNNVYEGYPRTDEGARSLFHDRLYLHLNVGGAASHLFAQRMNGRPPGLLVTPGEDTRWEFACHVPASLNTGYRWEGIPIVYVHSQAAIEREGWPEWFSGHSSLVLEPGDQRSYHMRFMSADRYRGDGVHAALVAAGRPSFRLFPAAVAPAEVGIAVEVAGCKPAVFETDAEAELETDSDEEGGFCFVRPAAPGPLRLRLEDTQGRESEAFLLLTEPIESLIKARAQWIVDNQIVTEGPLRYAIAPNSLVEGGPIIDPESYMTPFGIESGLCEALFLAEKNAIYPDAAQIAVLDDYLSKFLEAKVLNPGDGSLGSLLPNPEAVAVGHGRASLYMLAFGVYATMIRVAESYGSERSIEDYLKKADAIVRGLRANVDLASTTGLPLVEELQDFHETLRRQRRSAIGRAKEEPRAEDLKELQAQRARNNGGWSSGRLLMHRRADLVQRIYPYWTETGWGASSFSEAAFLLGQIRILDFEDPRLFDTKVKDRTLRYLSAARSLSPCWWWYASDKRFGEKYDGIEHPAMPDNGELTLGPSTAANSRRLLAELEKDGPQMDEARLRMAFGGMLAPWALVRPDGAAGMGYCPDPASRMFGVAWTSGDVGLSLFHYLRGVASYVLPSRTQGVVTFGCAFEVEGEGARETFIVRPWDGVGRRIVVRHVGLDARCEGARIDEMRVTASKRSATFSLRNSSDKPLTARLEVRGLWGTSFVVAGEAVESEGGVLKASLPVEAGTVRTVEIEVKG